MNRTKFKAREDFNIKLSFYPYAIYYDYTVEAGSIMQIVGTKDNKFIVQVEGITEKILLTESELIGYAYPIG